MNFYDVLAAEKLGGGIPTINFFDLLFAQYMGGGEQWETYEGTLPATLNANGADMRQYQIWGNTGGVGDDSGMAYGYKLDMGVKSGNVMPSAPAETKTSNGITITCDGEGQYNISGMATDKTSIRFDIPEFTIPVSSGQGGKGTMSLFNTATLLSADNKIGFYYNSELVDAWSLSTPNRVSDSYIKMGSMKCNAIVIDIATLRNVIGTLLPMFTDNGTLPDKYQPYSDTTTPIYIGSDPLGKDEYVDYQAQKVYRMINGTLTPTDPPVPLPALPTCEGTTIVDYAGSGTAPEKVYFEYQGGKQS